jgi:hypothetical protein
MTWCIQILLPGQKNRGSVTYQQAQPFPETPGSLVHSFFLAESVLVGFSASPLLALALPASPQHGEVRKTTGQIRNSQSYLNSQ